ncbi:hypothetical protein [Reichenbachiella sp.]
MNWIDKLFPVITLILGWGLSQFGEFWTDKKSDNKKLKKLLFNLLELRWLLKRELDLSKKITSYINQLKAKLSEEFGIEATQGVELFQPIITDILKEKIVDPVRIKEIESKIDFTINELAEIYPVFAYELSGRYKIKDRLEKADSYFNEVSKLLEEMPKELTDWIQPRMSDDLLTELDKYIIEIAEKINKKTKNQASEKLSETEDKETKEVNEFIHEYIERIKKYDQQNL